MCGTDVIIGIADIRAGREIFFHACPGPKYSNTLVPVRDVPNPNPNPNPNPTPQPELEPEPEP